MGYRLVATDLDGTVVRHDGVITERTRAALKTVERAGSEVVLVTGRPPRWLADVAAAFDHVGLAICGNGALVYDLHDGTVVDRHLIDPGTAVAAGERLRSALPGVAFAAESEDGFAREEAYVPRWDAGTACRVAPLTELADVPLVKLLARHEAMDADTMLAAAASALAGVCEVTHSTASRLGGLLEISAPGVSKASTLARLCEQRGIAAAEVVAFGDMPNDLAMLRWAGRPYAMASGHPAVIAEVGRVAPFCEEDGVAQVLESLFGQRAAGRLVG